MKRFRYHQDYPHEQVSKKIVDAHLIKRLWGYLKPYRFWLALAVLALVFAKGIEAYVPMYLGKLSQKILDSVHLSENARQPVIKFVIEGGLAAIGMLVLNYTLEGFTVLLKSWVSQKALFKLRLDVFNYIEKLPLSYYDTHTVGRLMTRTIHDVDQINQMFSESIVPIIGNIILFFSICVAILAINWKFGLIIGLVLPSVYWLVNNFRYNQRLCYDRLRVIVSAMNTFVQENLMGISIVRNFGLQRQEEKRFEKINEDHCTAYLETIHHFAFFIAGNDLLQNFSLILAFVILTAFAPIETGFQAGTYFTFSLYALMFFRPLADLADRYNVLQAAMASAERIFAILDEKTEPETFEHGPDLSDINHIAFEDVWFAYEKDNWVLKGLDFQIKKGESIALVGMTGAGKSTVMSLLLRFYDIQKGSIKINGRDIREYSLNTLRKQFSIVLQDPVLFSGTLEENITLFQQDLAKQNIMSAVDYVNLHVLIDRFSDGLKHMLHDRGKSLSVGQMQLISLARAVAQDRSMLILDEATANIDIGTEKVIQEALKKILHDKTALVIAHRLSTVQDANRIIVLHAGVVAETGSHQQLLQKKGIYEKLYRLLPFES